VSRVGAGLTSAGIVVALLIGGWSHTKLIGLPVITLCLFVATLLTIGSLERKWHSSRSNYAMAFRLLIINLIAGSLLMAAVGLLLGPTTPAGMGFLLLAAVPVAAGIPAYAGALGVPAERLSVFALMSYAIALLVTPLLLAVILGSTATWAPLLLTVIGGLLAPIILGVLLSGPIGRIPPRPRRIVVVAALLLAMVGLGNVLNPADLSSMDLGAPVLVVLLLALLRAPIGGLVGVALNRVTRQAPTNVEASLAGGYKNGALAGAVAIAAGVPAAAVPPAVGLVSEALLLGLVSLIGHRLDTSRDPTSRSGKAA
jgi:hypothetical protein